MRAEVLDDFEAADSAWMPVASGLAELRISGERDPQGAAMRLDFDFKGGGGFVVARRVFTRPMPESYALSFSVRGAAPRNRFELKLADPSGRNVWWYHFDGFEFRDEWQTIRLRNREIEFAWGPAGGGAMSELGAIELALAAPPGGAGTVWVRDLRLEDRTYRSTPVLRASSSQPGHPPDATLDGNVETSWHSAPATGAHWLEIDFREEREYGGLVIDWARGAQPRAFRVEGSADGSTWKPMYSAEPGGVERSFVYLPGAAARFLRLTLEAADAVGCGVAEIAVQPFEFSRSINAFFENVSRAEPRGHYPRWLSPEATYWTPIGLPDGNTCAIMNEEGMVEVDRGTFSIEPFVLDDGQLVTWADAEVAQTLEDGWMPLPSSVWRRDDVVLQTTAFACRCDGAPVLCLRYRLENTATRFRRLVLFAAIRPFQVNPPWQAFGSLGGTSRIATVLWDGRGVRVDDRQVVPMTAPNGFGAAAFEHGAITTYLARGVLPERAEVTDAFGYASGALRFDVDLDSGAVGDVYLAIPFGVATSLPVERLASIDGAAVLAQAALDWQDRLGAVGFELPSGVRDHADTVRTAAGHILINRDGPALQPGPRRYTRSWIRDGAIMAAALLRVGRSVEAREFASWYASHQADDGNVPCCVDRSGPDWLAEHDSHGELIFAAMEYYRFTGDRDLLAELWPAVSKAVEYLEKLRATRLGPEFDTPELRARRGLLPESASHEGYLAHPVHSYWDDFWALQGYRDAAAIAGIVGAHDDARHIQAVSTAFRVALGESVAQTIADRAIDYVPGSVEWADFDPTATANAISLLGGIPDLPRAQLDRTFDEYMAGFRRRRGGEIDWNNYTAYEVRIVGALVHLGRRDDAAELMEFLLADRRARAWNQWPEISWRNPRSPGHLGDVPHTWIGAEYILALRSMLAFERIEDGALVLTAGVPMSWLDDGAEVGVDGLPTYWGTLSFRLRREADGAATFSISGDVEPPGGIVLRPPLSRELSSVEVNGRTVASFDRDGATIASSPAEVVLR